MRDTVNITLSRLCLGAVLLACPALILAQAVTFSAATGAAAESISFVAVKITASGYAAEFPVTVDHVVNAGGTATGGGVDFTFTEGTLTFNANETQTILLEIVDDSDVESSETIILELTNLSSGSLAPNSTHTYTIIDDDGVAPVLDSVLAVPAQIPADAQIDFRGTRNFYQTIQIKLKDDGGSGWANNDNFTISMPSQITIPDLNGDASFIDEVSLSMTQLTVPSSEPSITGATASTITVEFNKGARLRADDLITVIFPIVVEIDPTEREVVYTVTMPASAEANNTIVASVSLVDFLVLVDFDDANYDDGLKQSGTLGDAYPSAAANVFTALPDLLKEEDSRNKDLFINGANDWDGVTLDGIEDGTEVTYTLWASQTRRLRKVTGGVAEPVFNLSKVPLTANEGGVLNTQIDISVLEEGYWFFYLTSNLTNAWALGESDTVEVRHWPTFSADDAAGGFDYDVDGVYESGAGADDDIATVVLESGGTLGKDGNLATGGNNLGSLDFFWNFDDLDDDAEIYIFSSTQDGLTADSLTIAGSEPDETVSGIGSASTALGSAISEASSTQFLTWDIYEDADTFDPAGVFHIYYVVNDGKNQQVYQLATNAGAAKTVEVKHYPFFKFDDVVPTDDLPIDTQTDDYYVISWAEDLDNDLDADGNAVISFYYTASSLEAILDAIGAGSEVTDASILTDPNWTGSVTLIGSTTEDPDSKTDNRFTWNIGTAGLTAATNYNIIAHLQEGSDHLFVQYTSALGPVQHNAPILVDRDFVISHSPYFTPDLPVAGEMITVSGADDIRFSWTAYDRDDASGNIVHIFAVPAGTDVQAVAGGATWTDVNGVDPAGWYWITSTTGENSLGASTGPSTESLQYVADIGALDTDMSGAALTPNGIFDVYYFASWDGTMNGESYDAAAGVIRFSGSTTAATSFRISPNRAVMSKGDTLSLDVYVLSASALNTSLLSISLSIPKSNFSVIDFSSAPFTNEIVNFSGTELLNRGVETDDHWEISLAEADNSPSASLDAAGGLQVASFKIVATADLTGADYISSVIQFLDEPGAKTSIIDENGQEEILTLPADAVEILLAPAGNISGKIELELIDESGRTVDVHLSNRGSFIPITDSLYLATNGGANSDGSVTVTLGVDGDYTLALVPRGVYDLFLRRSGYLDRQRTSLSVQPVSTTTLNFTGDSLMIVGDIAGYDDDNDASTFSIGDNQIDASDVTAISNAYNSVDGDANWNPAADLDLDGIVSLVDYQVTVANTNQNGDGLVYKQVPVVQQMPAARIVLIAENDGFETYALVVTGVAGIKGYDVALPAAVSTAAISIKSGLSEYGRIKQFTFIDGGLSHRVSALVGRHSLADGPQITLLTLTVPAGFAINDLRFDHISIVDGRGRYLFLQAASPPVPVAYALHQNYPNPFNPATTLRFELPAPGDIQLIIFNLLGAEVATLVDGFIEAGSHSVNWAGRDATGRVVPAGIYFARLVTPSFTKSIKMILLK
ncbi:MAG: T9SS type A sorting domain-containing protein [Candidatus Marinimicrobia bacterium]|nr:T9SS type A sorting domain-containing protein [Candidatus Neomarinimicrobiota bacterium]